MSATPTSPKPQTPKPQTRNSTPIAHQHPKSQATSIYIYIYIYICVYILAFTFVTIVLIIDSHLRFVILIRISPIIRVCFYSLGYLICTIGMLETCAHMAMAGPLFSGSFRFTPRLLNSRDSS